MGPTKVILKGSALYEAESGKLVHNGLMTRQAVEEYSRQHYVVLPEVDNAGKPWELDGQPVYCLRGTRYEMVNGNQAHLARCPLCGGMGIRIEEVTIERDCIRCTKCEHEFDARLEMMES
jgi:hypothetical protein